jgi:ATP-dependent Clp protease ATP-binding subunit ClpA
MLENFDKTSTMVIDLSFNYALERNFKNITLDIIAYQLLGNVEIRNLLISLTTPDNIYKINETGIDTIRRLTEIQSIRDIPKTDYNELDNIPLNDYLDNTSFSLIAKLQHISEVNIFELFLTLFDFKNVSSYILTQLRTNKIYKKDLIYMLDNETHTSRKKRNQYLAEKYDHTMNTNNIIQNLTGGSNQIVPSKQRKRHPVAKTYPVLEEFAQNMNKKVSDVNFQKIYGRDSELTRVMEILIRKNKNNPLLLGQPGVGKTSIIESLAMKINSGDVPTKLKNKVIYSLEINNIIAGSTFRGDLEKKVKNIISEVEGNDEIILFIDEIHTLVSSSNDSSFDLVNVFKPALARGTFTCIGATTFEEEKKYFSKDKALNRRFQSVKVEEPSIEDAINIISHTKSSYEKEHNIIIQEDILEDIVTLSKKLITERYLPDSAFDVIDEIGASHSLHSDEEKIVTITDVEDIISKITHRKIKNTKNNSKVIKSLDKNLKRVIFGQDNNIDKVIQEIIISKAGLKEDNKPIGSFLFTGVSGTGKTELAKVLASQMDMNFIRYNMSEYMEQHTISALLGSPDGYTGNENGGKIVSDIKEHPNSVVLIDEIEKAHPDIMNIFLQVLDDAVVTDRIGRVGYFNESIVIFTSNIGAKPERKMGFGNHNAKKDSFEEIKDMFPVELLNRFSEVLLFESLEEKSVKLLVDKFISELNIKLEKKDISIKLTTGAKKFLVEEYYKDGGGAREIKANFENNITNIVSKEIVFNQPKSKVITISLKNKEFLIKE